MISRFEIILIAIASLAIGVALGSGLAPWGFAAIIIIACIGFEAWKRWC